jgi:hypothetical protein
MGTLLFSTKGKILLSSLLAGIASLIHPTLGLETGALALAAYFIANLSPIGKTQSKMTASRYREAIAAVIMFGAFAALWWFIFQSNEDIPDVAFIDILAYFRHPHHYLPSKFPLSDYIFTVIFMLNFGIAWVFWRRNHIVSKKINLFVLSYTVLVIVACAAGYVFVEIIPTRLFLSAQVFRLLLIIKWLGFGVIATNIGLGISNRHSVLSVSDGYLLAIGVISPILMLLIQIFLLLRTFWIDRASQFFNHLQSTGPLFLVSVLMGALFISSGFSSLDTRSIAAFLALVMFMFLMEIWLPEGTRGQIFSLSITIGLVLLLYLIPLVVPPYYENYVRGLRPELGMKSRKEGELALVGDYVRNNLPVDAVLITPPGAGELRLIADRAIVVDYKAFPFSDSAMEEWRSRLFDLYGVPASEGYEVLWELETNYRSISEERLLDKAKKYGACFALLYSGTETYFEVLFSSHSYNLIELPICDST